SSAVVDVIATKHTTLFKNSRELYQGAWHDAYSKGYNKTSMVDPDMGTWYYETDALGRLREQTDAKNTVTRNNYDKLGRMTSRTIGSSTFTYTYDGATGAGKGKPYQEWGPGGFYKYYTYDSYGRVLHTTQRFDDDTDGDCTYQYQMTNSYDSYGRLEKIYYPQVAGFSQRYYVQNVYDNSTGAIKEVKDSAGKTWWKSPKYDALGRLESYAYGGSNLIRTDVDYEGGTGFIESIKGYKSGYSSPTVQNWSFTFDDVGNLTYRKNHLVNKSETYTYDALNRIDKVNNTNVVDYDDIGNITWKDGVGSYQYLSSRPHAVTKVAGGASYIYDANGNITGYEDRDITWTSFNKPLKITKGGLTVFASFQYDADLNRIAEYENGRRKHYMAGMYERVFETGSSTKHRHFIPTPAGVVGSYDTIEYGLVDRSYFHKDHLGSIVKVTNDSAGTVDAFAYDVWGEPANPSTWSPLSTWDHEPSKDRGFTGHEMLDNVQLVHMNGRIYDPKLGRFLSPDIYVQESADMQSFNRYSYVFNNPLSYTDPSGHIVTVIVGVIAKAVGIKGGMYIGIVAASAAVEVAVNGGSTQDIARAFVFAAFSAGIADSVGTIFEGSETFWGEFARAATHGATQGGLTDLQGGDFMSGFASAFVASAAGSAMQTDAAQQHFDTLEKRTIAAAIVGGTASELSGGSFANGAITGAFVQLFNHEHDEEGEVPVAESGDDEPIQRTIFYDASNPDEVDFNRRVAETLAVGEFDRVIPFTENTNLIDIYDRVVLSSEVYFVGHGNSNGFVMGGLAIDGTESEWRLFGKAAKDGAKIILYNCNAGHCAQNIDNTSLLPVYASFDTVDVEILRNKIGSDVYFEVVPTFKNESVFARFEPK
ncbi:hypothetical protein MLD52_22210, partial [Puniceicoccaceae bacterium K14]|nr:hypothetical protein [Puniceicoccaceae bacterium K14]